MQGRQRRSRPRRQLPRPAPRMQVKLNCTFLSECEMGVKVGDRVAGGGQEKRQLDSHACTCFLCR